MGDGLGTRNEGRGKGRWQRDGKAGIKDGDGQGARGRGARKRMMAEGREKVGIKDG